MSFLDYNQNIPASQNNPSDDQPKMRTNTNSTRDWVQIDHFGFKDTQGGLHKQARIVNQLNIPAGLTAQMGTIYTKLATSTGVLKESNLFFTPGTSGNEYQLTRVITASFSFFSTLTQNYNGVGTAYFGGWTFLPGGLLFQYGMVNVFAGHTTALNTYFPVPFTNVNSIIITVSAISTNETIAASGVKTGSVTTTQFATHVNASSGVTGYYWHAIGK